MWKFVARGIRETLERRACRTNVYSQSSQDGNNPEVKTSLTCDQKTRSPETISFKGFCGSTKSSGTKDKQEDSKWDTKHSWSEAVGWSSILAVGWVVCQTLCLRKTIFERENRQPLRHQLSEISEDRFRYVFNQVLNLERKHVLPITHCAGKTSKELTGDTEVGWTSSEPFGPITAEEALNEATFEFVKAHNYVNGQYEHHYGIRALEEKRYRDAIRHFRSGAKLSSPASMFNLGLCYELGLGTSVDEAKAVKYYRDAASQGHADAIYNLGVFHAQGRGGFSVDANQARRCFVHAAKLGQTQAQHALDLEKNYHDSHANGNSTTAKNTHASSISYVGRSTTNNILSKLAGYSSISEPGLDIGLLEETSNYDNTSCDTKTATEIFLDFLGLSEPRSLPVAVVPNNCSVPC